MDNSTQNITIILESQIVLRSAITFKNYEFFALEGASDSAKLTCNCRKRGAGISLLFLQINRLVLSRSAIRECCGASDTYYAAILIQESLNVDIENFRIHNNVYSSGLVLVNPRGEVNIKNCRLESNGQKRLSNDTSFAGGLHIQFSQQVITPTTVTIESCKFIQNKSPKVDGHDISATKDLNDRQWDGKSFGGGMGIAILKTSNATKVYIFNCVFAENSAKWGGGLCVYMQQQTYNNTIFVYNSTFVNNTAVKGGGGLEIRLGLLDKYFRNYIHFHKVTFERNSANFGGGTSVSALLGNFETEPGEILMFVNCTWHANNGHYATAVDISPYRFERPSQGYAPIPLFRDIYVRKNLQEEMHIIELLRVYL